MSIISPTERIETLQNTQIPESILQKKSGLHNMYTVTGIQVA